MASTNYTDFTTPAIVAAWLNDVNEVCYNVVGNMINVPTTGAQLLTNVGGAASGNNADITSLQAGVTIPTPTATDNSTKIATTAFVQEHSLQIGTVVSVAGNTQFTVGSIPSTVMRVDVNLSSIASSGSGSGEVIGIQLGTSAGLYNGSAYFSYNTPSAASSSTYFPIYNITPSSRIHGTMTLRLIDPTNYVWGITGLLADTGSSVIIQLAGSVTLPGNLTQFQFFKFTHNFTGSGEMNILYT